MLPAPQQWAVQGAAGEFGKTQRAQPEGLFCYSGAIYWSEPTGMANGSRKRGEHRWMVWCGHGPGWHTDVLSASPLLSPGVTPKIGCSSIKIHRLGLPGLSSELCQPWPGVAGMSTGNWGWSFNYFIRAAVLSGLDSRLSCKGLGSPGCSVSCCGC